MGVFPIDVEAAHIDALAADGHKWMLGPEGNGILYIRRQWFDSIEPVEFGWTNPANYADYSSRDMTLRADAGRYECGTLNTVGCFGHRASLEFLLEVGIANVGASVMARAAQLDEGFARSVSKSCLTALPPTAQASFPSAIPTSTLNCSSPKCAVINHRSPAPRLGPRLTALLH